MAAAADCALFNFVVWGVCGGVLCAFGYVGNLLNIIALQREDRTATTTLLQSLATSDLVLLVSVAVTDAVPYICDFTGQCTNPWIGWPHVRYVWLLTPLAHMTSIWLVVLVAANRYWAVCRPHAASTVWTSPKTVRYVAAVVFCVVAFNFPRIFEYRIVERAVVVVNGSANATRPGVGGPLDGGIVVVHADIHDVDDLGVYNGDDFGYDHPSRQTIDGIARWRTDWDQQMMTTATVPPTGTGTGSNETAIGTTTTTPVVRRMREEITQFGRTPAYRYGYKVLFVNFILVLVPLVTLIVLSVFVIRTLKRTPSYRLSLVHTKPLMKVGPQDSPPDGNGAAARGPDTGPAAPTSPGPDGEEDGQPAENGDTLTSQNGRNRKLGLSFKRLKERMKGSIERSDSKSSTGSRGASREVTFVLVTVVLVAVVCQTPLAVFHCVRYAVSAYSCGHVVFYLETGAKLLVNINSCANFVIYCLLSPKFRRRLLDALTCRPSTSGRFGSASHGPGSRRAEPAVEMAASRR